MPEPLGREVPNLSYTHALILLGVPEEDLALERVSNKLVAAQIKLLTAKIAFCYESLEKVFKEPTYEMGLLAKVIPRCMGSIRKS